MAPTRLRTRLVLAFSYILLTVIVALTVPLAFNLTARGLTELESVSLVAAQQIAATLDRSDLDEPGTLASAMERAEGYEQIVILDGDGTVVADSTERDLGLAFDNAQRPEVRAALAGEPLAERRFSDTLGREILVAAAPIWQEDEVVGAVRVTRDAQDVTETARRTTIALAIVGGAALLGGVVIAFALAGSLTRPLQRLVAAARRLGAGDLSARAGEISGPKEVVALAHSFDEMGDRLERTVTAQREFVANASHQLRTPLTGMKLRLESAIADAPDELTRRQLEAAERETDRLAGIVDRLLVLARRIEDSSPTTVDLAEAAGRAVERWRDRAGVAGSTIEAAGSNTRAVADPSDVDQILDALLDNAVSYAPGPIEIETAVRDGSALLSVTDHGDGIPEQDLERVTERFYRGRGAPPGGSGLGLSIATELAAATGGTLELERPPDGGTRVAVRFPVATGVSRHDGISENEA